MSFLKTCNLFNLLFFSMLLAFIFISGCEKGTSPIDSPEMLLTVADVGVTEAWLHLEVKNLNASNQITILRGDSTIQQFSNFFKDSIIYDQDLLPKHNYTYTATLTANGQTLIAESQIATMDTTSHDFTWEVYSYGDNTPTGHHFQDVVIINENDIWAVGYIDLFNDSLIYNAAHWDGNGWELKTINYEFVYGSGPAYSECVFAFDTNTVIACSGGGFMKWNGSGWNVVGLFDSGDTSFLKGAIQKIWGNSINDMLAVGYNGALLHYNGNNWQPINSGTDIDLLDIWGNQNGHAWISGYDASTLPFKSTLLHYYNGVISTLFQSSLGTIVNGIESPVFTVWATNRFMFTVVGSGILRKSVTNDKINRLYTWHELGLEDGYFHRLRGNDINDMFLVGNRSYLAHFNGKTWKRFSFSTGYTFRSVSIHNDLVVVAGHDYFYPGSNAIILMGRR